MEEFYDEYDNYENYETQAPKIVFGDITTFYNRI